MNGGLAANEGLVRGLLAGLVSAPSCDIAVAVPALYLAQVQALAAGSPIAVASQDVSAHASGAYTGEVSAAQLKGIADYVLIGHSERRYQFNETDKDIRAKVQAAMRNHLLPVLCVGETALERSTNETIDVLHDQLVGGLANITSDELAYLTIAYEPVWAIGTGENAMPKDVKFAVSVIRKQISQLFGAKFAKEVRVLYGGSVNIDNAKSYLEIQGVDGLLIGGASLDAHQFAEIVDQAYKLDDGRII